MKTIKAHHELHLKCDVLLFTDGFENFRNKSLKNYGLCPNRYLSAPAFKLGCNAQYDKRWAWAYSRSWHTYILLKRYERWSFLYF